MSIARRLSKLCAALPAPKSPQFTREEQKLLEYLVAQAALRTDRFPATRARLAARVEELERQIRRKANTPITDQLRSHVEYVENVWVASGRELPFVPPILGEWWDDWFAPDLTAKRLAVRRHPAILALLGDTTASPWGCWL